MLEPPVGPTDHSRGPQAAPVTLVEYGDYQSEACRQADGFVKEAERRLKGRIRLVFRHFAINQVHPYSQHAAEAAGAQGQFWQMHDLLFGNPDALDDADLVGYANDIGLDTARFLHDVAGHVHAARIEESLRGGVRSGVDSTPAFFINGIRYDSEWQHGDALLQAITRVASSDA